MKKRLLAGFLSLVMVLSLLPTAAFAATGTAGVANVYTLADIKAATEDSSVTTIRLMNDIDANKESISYYRSSDYTTVADSLRQGVTLDGQGHTIYNLKTTLLRVNAGTIKNLNTTVHDTPEDSERLVYHMTAQYSGAQVNISGIAVQNSGTIESCNTLFTLEGERSQVTFRLSGITAYNDGTIRDCIASYDVDYHIKNGGAWLTGAASFAGLAYSNSGLIDHSLVLGSVIVSGDAYCSDAIGLTNMSQCTDSACALERLSLTCNDEIDFSPAFQTYTGSMAGAKNCRVAADLQVTNISEKKNIHESGTVSGGKGYTLASRADILKDWDTSGVPGETPPANITTDMDTDDIPDDYIPIYTLADLKTKTHDGYYLLMNDIDANQEDVKYDGNGYNANSVCGRLFSGGVLNGNGHTIYNLRGPLFECNMGTIRNLNITLTNRGKDTDTFDVGKSLAGIALSNYNGGADGLIEDCTVTMTVHRTFGKLAGDLSINGISSGGTIRNCIANLSIVLEHNSSSAGSGTIQVSGIGYGTNFSLVEHCLVLGGISVQSTRQSVHFSGISNGTARNSACALEKLTVVSRSSRLDPYEYFTLSAAKALSNTVSYNSRVASDMKVSYMYNGTSLLNGKPATQTGTFTLDTRENILKDWDLSVLPDENMPEPTPEPTVPADGTDPFPEGDVWFSYSATDGSVKKHSFHYDSDYFNKNGMFQMPLAVASLCLEMASFSNNLNLSWDTEQKGDTPGRAANILELYGRLGFTNAACVNYDKPLSNTSDKVAFSMAMKYIDNGKGGTDTLVAVPIRGGGYGGEWASNFYVTYDWKSAQYTRHLGFDTAAQQAKKSVQEYLDTHTIKGDVKIWLVGFSRGAAVANLLGHYLAEEATPGGIRIQRKNLYAYTFATPAGVSEHYMDDSDTNMFNLISPVDLVPMVAPGNWGYGRYGQTVQLTPDFSHEALEKFRLCSGLTGTDKELTIKSSQRYNLLRFTDWLCVVIPDAGNYCQSGIQTTVSRKTGELLGTNPIKKLQEEAETSDIKVMQTVIKQCVKIIDAAIHPVDVIVKEGVKWSVKEFIKNEVDLAGIGRAHYPELYLTWLEMKNDMQLDALEKAAEEKQLVIQEPYVNVRFWDKSSGASAGSYVSGVCNSGEVEITKESYGLVATFPAGKDYAFSVAGNGSASSVSFSIFTYDNDSIGDYAAASQFTDLPLDGGKNYTVTVSDDPYADYYAVDQSGKTYAEDGGTSRMNFTDVPEGAYFHDAVEWAVEEGITSGTTATTFSPYNACTRAQVVTFLWRAAGSPEPESSYNPFWDVPEGAYYHDAVLWAAEEGITTGVSANRFDPNATVTRGQTVTFLWRWDGEPEMESRSTFRDVSAGVYYADAVSWAVEMGITNGTSVATFSPNETCTRAQIVTFLYRDLRDVYEEDYEDYDYE